MLRVLSASARSPKHGKTYPLHELGERVGGLLDVLMLHPKDSGSSEASQQNLAELVGEGTRRLLSHCNGHCVRLWSE